MGAAYLMQPAGHLPALTVAPPFRSRQSDLPASPLRLLLHGLQLRSPPPRSGPITQKLDLTIFILHFCGSGTQILPPNRVSCSVSHRPHAAADHGTELVKTTAKAQTAIKPFIFLLPKLLIPLRGILTYPTNCATMRRALLSACLTGEHAARSGHDHA